MKFNRLIALLLLLVMLVGTASGCAWFDKGTDGTDDEDKDTGYSFSDLTPIE